MRKMLVTTAFLAVFIFAFAAAKPANAFYLNIPEIIKSWLNRASAQEGSGYVAPAPQQSIMESQPQQMQQPMQQQPYSDTNNFQPQQTQDGQSTAWCMVNGVKMSGPCSNYNDNNNQPQQQYDQSNQQNQQGAKDMLRGIKQIESNLKKFETMMINFEKKGTVVPQEIKDKVTKVRGVIDAAKNAKEDELQNIDMGDLQEDMNTLEEARRDIFEAAQRMDGMKRGMKGAEQGIKMFERQLAKLAKQKIIVPSEISDNLSKIKALITLVKNAKTWAEIEDAGVEDMGDLFSDLDQYREQLEMLSRWPQTLRDINRQVMEMERGVKRAKSTSDRLAKKGIDVSANLSQFQEAVAKMKSIRDEAVAKVQAGDGRAAFDLLESDFFGQTDDVWQNMKIIDMMSNLGRFSSDFKRGMADAQRQVKMLARKKIDTTELQELLDNAKAKGNEIIAMLKGGDIDEDEVISAMEELETYGQEFQNKMDELTGGEDMPWEKGPKQFQEMKAPSAVIKYAPKKPASSVSEPAPSMPAPAPSVEPSSGGMGL